MTALFHIVTVKTQKTEQSIQKKDISAFVNYYMPNITKTGFIYNVLMFRGLRTAVLGFYFLY